MVQRISADYMTIDCFTDYGGSYEVLEKIYSFGKYTIYRALLHMDGVSTYGTLKKYATGAWSLCAILMPNGEEGENTDYSKFCDILFAKQLKRIRYSELSERFYREEITHEFLRLLRWFPDGIAVVYIFFIVRNGFSWDRLGIILAAAAISCASSFVLHYWFSQNGLTY